MAPEVFTTGTTDYVSDVWSFAVTIGHVLGYWCGEEVFMPKSLWEAKVFHLGSRTLYSEPSESVLPGNSQRERLQALWCTRLVGLADLGLIARPLLRPPGGLRAAPPRRKTPGHREKYVVGHGEESSGPRDQPQHVALPRHAL